MITPLPLLEGEHIMLDELETRIETALKAIRDGKLYKETHTDFAAYVRARWIERTDENHG